MGPKYDVNAPKFGKRVFWNGILGLVQQALSKLLSKFKLTLKIIVQNKLCGSLVWYPLRNLKYKQQ